MEKTIIETRTASTDQELTVNLMADELHARGADLSSKVSVVSTLTAAEFRADRIEQLCESAALTAWYRCGTGTEWKPWEEEGKA